MKSIVYNLLSAVLVNSLIRVIDDLYLEGVSPTQILDPDYKEELVNRINDCIDIPLIGEETEGRLIGLIGDVLQEIIATTIETRLEAAEV